MPRLSMHCIFVKFSHPLIIILLKTRVTPNIICLLYIIVQKFKSHRPSCRNRPVRQGNHHATGNHCSRNNLYGFYDNHSQSRAYFANHRQGRWRCNPQCQLVAEYSWLYLLGESCRHHDFCSDCRTATETTETHLCNSRKTYLFISTLLNLLKNFHEELHCQDMFYTNSQL